MSRSRPLYRERAVVVGAGINGLGVLRGLARAGVPVVVVGESAALPAMRSRYGRKMVVASGGEALIVALEALADERPDQPAVLILTEEEAVAAAMRAHPRLEQRYRTTFAPGPALAPLMNKAGIEAVAQRAGLRVPQTRRVTAADEIDRIEALAAPLIVKPAVRDAGYGARFKKAYRVADANAAKQRVREILPVLADVVVQEWINGTDADLYFCLQYLPAGEAPAGAFTGRKLRSWPPEVGGTASCMPAPEAEALEAMTTRFFRTAGITGLASLEYKFDAARGDYFIIEPTVGRTDFQQEVAALNGVDLVLAAYCDVLGYPAPSTSPPPTPRVWRERTADVQARQASAAPAAAPPGSKTVNALWRAYDPRPALAPLAARVRARLQRAGQTKQAETQR